MKKNKTKKIYKKKDFNSSDGMLTSVWGPSLWHSIHTISFNYPIKPTINEKKNYKNFIIGLQHILPCNYCRINLKKNFKLFPLKNSHLKNRYTFSKYIYNLHERINKCLNKHSGLSYEDVRERYEHFRARCSIETKKKKQLKKTLKKEKGCTIPFYGKKSKCIIKIVPSDTKCKTFQIDKECKKSK
jgi:hypothetical protein